MIHARVFAQHLQKYTDQNVVIKVVPGAVGITAANYLYNVSPKDGSEIGTIDSRVFIQGVIKSDTVQYDLKKFGWLGSAVDNRNDPFVVWSKAKTERLIAGSESGFAVNHIKIVNKVLKWDVREVIGYADSNQVRMAFEKDEINLVAYGLTGIRTTVPGWLKDSSIIPKVQYGAGTKRHRDLSQVPTLMELATSEEDRDMINMYEQFLILGRTFSAPPGLPEDKLNYLRGLFDTVMQDPEYRADAAKIGVEVSPVSWIETVKIVNEISSGLKNLELSK